jgi:hypothetical protein
MTGGNMNDPKTKKQLHLKKETMRDLDAQQLSAAQGAGGLTDCTWWSCPCSQD